MRTLFKESIVDLLKIRQFNHYYSIGSKSDSIAILDQTFPIIDRSKMDKPMID